MGMWKSFKSFWGGESSSSLQAQQASHSVPVRPRQPSVPQVHQDHQKAIISLQQGMSQRLSQCRKVATKPLVNLCSQRETLQRELVTSETVVRDFLHSNHLKLEQYPKVCKIRNSRGILAALPVLIAEQIRQLDENIQRDSLAKTHDVNVAQFVREMSKEFSACKSGYKTPLARLYALKSILLQRQSSSQKIVQAFLLGSGLDATHYPDYLKVKDLQGVPRRLDRFVGKLLEDLLDEILRLQRNAQRAIDKEDTAVLYQDVEDASNCSFLTAASDSFVSRSAGSSFFSSVSMCGSTPESVATSVCSEPEDAVSSVSSTSS